MLAQCASVNTHGFSRYNIGQKKNTFYFERKKYFFIFISKGWSILNLIFIYIYIGQAKIDFEPIWPYTNINLHISFPLLQCYRRSKGANKTLIIERHAHPLHIYIYMYIYYSWFLPWFCPGQISARGQPRWHPEIGDLNLPVRSQQNVSSLNINLNYIYILCIIIHNVTGFLYFLGNNICTMVEIEYLKTLFE